MDIEKVTRFEVIDHTGRILVKRNVKIEFSYQDDGRTLKVFMNDRVSDSDAFAERVDAAYEAIKNVATRK